MRTRNEIPPREIRTLEEREEQRQFRQFTRMLRRALVTPGTVLQADMEAEAAEHGEPITPLPSAFGVGFWLPLTRERRRGAGDDRGKASHHCTVAELRTAEAVAFASGVPGRTGAIMAYRHMREHGRLDVVRAAEELGLGAWVEEQGTEKTAR